MYASFAFDAVWILALAFEKARKTMDLENFKFKEYSRQGKFPKPCKVSILNQYR